jgi:hypothetical protein
MSIRHFTVEAHPTERDRHRSFRSPNRRLERAAGGAGGARTVDRGGISPGRERRSRVPAGGAFLGGKNRRRTRRQPLGECFAQLDSRKWQKRWGLPHARAHACRTAPWRSGSRRTRTGAPEARRRPSARGALPTRRPRGKPSRRPARRDCTRISRPSPTALAALASAGTVRASATAARLVADRGFARSPARRGDTIAGGGTALVVTVRGRGSGIRNYAQGARSTSRRAPTRRSPTGVRHAGRPDQPIRQRAEAAPVMRARCRGAHRLYGEPRAARCRRRHLRVRCGRAGGSPARSGR